MSTTVRMKEATRASGTPKGGEQTIEAATGHTISEVPAKALDGGLVGSIAELQKIEADLVLLVRKTMSDTLRSGGSAAGELVNVVHHVVMGAISAAEKAGTGLTLSVKSVAEGIVMGVHDVGDDVVVATAAVIRSIVKHAGHVGADIGLLTQHAVDGVIEATVKTGEDVSKIGKGAIEGTIEEAKKVSKMAVAAVREVRRDIRGHVDDGAKGLDQSLPKPHQAVARSSTRNVKKSRASAPAMPVLHP